MKYTIEVLIVMGTLLFGISIVSWSYNFTPSYNRKNKIEISIFDVDPA